MYKRDQLFRDLGKYFQTIGIFVLGTGFVWLKTELDQNRHDQDLIIYLIIITGVILVSLNPILLILNYIESRKSRR